MVTEFKFPDVGEGIVEGHLIKWLVKEGDNVKQDQSLAEVETDKAIIEIPSPVAGVVLKLHAKADSIVNVGEVFVTLGDKGEKVSAGKKAVAKEKEVDVHVGSTKPNVLAPLAVRKLAESLKVDLTQVHGTGFGGRITEDDVKSFGGKKPVVNLPKIDYSKYGPIEKKPFSNIRKIISDKMSQSKHSCAHVTHIDEAEVSNLVALRKEKKKDAAANKISLTYLPFITKACIASLKKHKYLNASLQDEVTIVKKYYNIGIAIDTKDGLIVPNIKNADKLGIMDLAKKIQEMGEKAQARKLSLDELQGGTFTLSNVGSVGGIYFTPVINYPEVAILGIGRIIEKTRVINGKIEIKPILPLSLSYDHRVVDGADAARLMNDIIKELENPL